MKRGIFDTNVYGNLIREPDFSVLSKMLSIKRSFIIYGYLPIRKELRKIPKVNKSSMTARIALLNLYDDITKNHFLEDSKDITNLAKKYHDIYKSEGGIYGWKTGMMVDLKIVACASMNSLDIIYTGDNRTLRSKNALKAYELVNSEFKLKTPKFLSYYNLIEKLRKLL